MKISQLTKALYFLIDTPGFNKDCISKGQLDSKEWLVNEVEKLHINLGTVFLCAGWYATLATLILESNIVVSKIRSFDVDPTCADIADKINAHWTVDNWKFKAVTENINDINYSEHSWQVWSDKNNRLSKCITDLPDTIINTSCEHISDFTKWYDKIPNKKIVILQTNNFVEIEDHVNCSNNIREFADQTPMSTVFFEGELVLAKYTRFMRIGIK
jgi:hypothetical protein